jgi:hypothetical protein
VTRRIPFLPKCRPPLSAGTRAGLADAAQFIERFEHPIEETRWKKTKIIAISIRDFSQIIAGPEKIVAFGDNDPGAGVVKPEMALDRQGYLYRPVGVIRCVMRDRQHRDIGGLAARALAGKHDYSRAVLASFFMTSQMLMVPQVSVGNDETGFRRRDRHRPGLFVKHGVEMRVPNVHPRGADGSGLLLR